MMRALRTASGLFLSFIAMSCGRESSPAGPTISATELVFLTQSEPQVAYMDALFIGDVVIDDQRCTRLGDAEGATVVWPSGYTVVRAGNTLRVVDGTGHLVGELGSSFRLGGGEVDILNPALHISYMDRALAHESCPGKYWIAAPGR
jgi:hypothetical protein